MRALAKMREEPGALEILNLPWPKPAPGEAVVRVAAAAICGSDLHIFSWDPLSRGFLRPPVVLGHEFAGSVEAIGSSVTQVAVGDLVVAESVVWCGVCGPCQVGRTNICDNRRLTGVHRPGGMAEAVAVPVRLLHRLPDALPPVQAAVVEPLTVATHAVLVDPPRPGDILLVTGPGPIGLLVGQVARLVGAQVLVSGAASDRDLRLPTAERLGLRPLDPSQHLAEAVRDATGGRLADRVIECSGAAKALEAGISALASGGTITLVGLFASSVEADLSRAIRREVQLRTSYSGTWDDYERSIRFLASGAVSVEPLTTTYALTDAHAAFQDAQTQRVMKPVLIPDTSGGVPDP